MVVVRRKEVVVEIVDSNGCNTVICWPPPPCDSEVLFCRIRLLVVEVQQEVVVKKVDSNGCNTPRGLKTERNY